MATREQIERVHELRAQAHELLSLDIRDYDRQDHIDIAREMVQIMSRGLALAMEVEDAEYSTEADALTEASNNIISYHLRIAEAMR